MCVVIYIFNHTYLYKGKLNCSAMEEEELTDEEMKEETKFQQLLNRVIKE